MRVETVRTTPTRQEFCDALRRAWPEATKEGAAILYAHYAGETGDGKYCWNWNLGNVKWTASSGLNYVALRGVWEIINGQRVELDKEDPGSWFRAYPSLDAGMAAFVKGKQAGRYAGAWPFVLDGDPEGYAKALRDKGYYTAPLADYQKSMRRFFDAFMAEVKDFNPEEPPATLRDFQVVYAMPDPVKRTPDFDVD